MKFFTKELWDKVNSATGEDQTKVENEWLEVCKSYAIQFNNISKLWPEEFLQKYSNNNEFHDFGILGIKILKSKSKSIPFLDLKLSIFDGRRKYTIHYEAVSRLNICSFESNEIAYLMNREEIIDSWGYDEFEIGDNGLLVHQILFLSGSTIEIQFNNINIVEEVLI